MHSFLSAGGGSVVDLGVESEAPAAPVGLLPGGIAVVEAASVRSADERPARASTAPAGAAIARAPSLREGIRAVFVATGDSGAVDGGSGAARAAGYRFLDHRGWELDPGGLALCRLARIDPSRARIDETVSIVAACDSGEVLLGPSGAARAGGLGNLPEAEIGKLEEGLAVLADRISADLGREVTGLEGGASGGGLAAGLAGFFGAEIVPGFELLVERTGLGETLGGADLLLTAVRRLGEDALRGGPLTGVVSLARERGISCFAVAGGISVDQATLRRRGFDGVISAFGPFGEPASASNPAEELAGATTRLLVRSQEPFHRRRRRLGSFKGAS